MCNNIQTMFFVTNGFYQVEQMILQCVPSVIYLNCDDLILVIYLVKLEVNN